MSRTATINPAPTTTVVSVLGAASLCHLLNDLMQALLPATYPIFQDKFGLSFADRKSVV